MNRFICQENVDFSMIKIKHFSLETVEVISLWTSRSSTHPFSIYGKSSLAWGFIPYVV